MKERRYKSEKLMKSTMQSFFSQDSMPSDVYSVRSRYQIGMVSNSSIKSPSKSPESLLPSDPTLMSLSSVCSFNMSLPEDIDEEVTVGNILNLKAPCASFGDFKQRRNLQSYSEVFDREKFMVDRIPKKLLSLKNPFNSSERLPLFNMKKRFLAADGFNKSSLSLELGPPKVLLVEDNTIHREAIAQRLKEACKWDADIACNGEEALQKYKDYASLNYRYTAIFMDTTMPLVDGYTATKRIRAIELSNEGCPTRIIGLLSRFEQDSATKCLDAGMNSTSKGQAVQKDISVSDLSALIKSIEMAQRLSADKSDTEAQLMERSFS